MTGIPPNRDRFLAGIAERIAPERVQELYLFAPMRQGAVETGVAVIAADRVTAPRPNDGGAERGEDGAELAAVVADEAHDEAAVEPVEAPIPDPRSLIPVVLTARYRHTLKGADRGKWELEILEQADAPLVTVEKVIRGVQQRLDEASEPELVGVEALRAALAEGVWTPPQR